VFPPEVTESASVARVPTWISSSQAVERGGASGPAEDLLELVRGGLGELVVAAVAGGLVGAPALELGGVAEPHALEVLEGDLADQADADRLPGQVLAAVPAAGRAGEALLADLVLPLGPVAPGVNLARVLAEGFELGGELGAAGAGEGGGDADVVENAVSS
jgi:hypothetical protein